MYHPNKHRQFLQRNETPTRDGRARRETTGRPDGNDNGPGGCARGREPEIFRPEGKVTGVKIMAAGEGTDDNKEETPRKR